MHRRRTLVGVAVGAGWLLALVAVAPLVGGFGLNSVAQSIIGRSPGWLSTFAIDLMGFYAQTALVAGVAAGVLVVTTALALGWPSFPGSSATKRAVAALGGVVVTAAVLLPVAGGLTAGFLAALVLATAAPALVGYALTTSAVVSADRRDFLRRVGSVAVVGGLSAVGARALFGRFADPNTAEGAGEPLDRSVSQPSGDPDFDFGGMPTAVTPPEEHYTVDITVETPTVDPGAWSLDIDGEVGRPYSLSYDDLLDHDESFETTMTMICISNSVGGELIGTGHWTGVQLSDLVAAADPTDDAVDVVTRAVDGYSEAIPIEIAEREDILIAYGMGENTLEPEHGFPARLLIPGRYGMKMTKWIEGIEVSNESHEAYWEERGWDEEAVVNTMSYIRTIQREGGTVAVGGVAFAGLETGVEEIRAVEVSVDGGETWSEAALEEQFDPHAWRRWRAEFDEPDGAFEVVARAIERDGEVQTEAESDGAPDGSTGWHRIEVD
jgi:DMSO/TMAO reductase YedYZ molybdopterin-dependent catalytic subunit